MAITERDEVTIRETVKAAYLAIKGDIPDAGVRVRYFLRYTEKDFTPATYQSPSLTPELDELLTNPRVPLDKNLTDQQIVYVRNLAKQTLIEQILSEEEEYFAEAAQSATDAKSDTEDRSASLLQRHELQQRQETKRQLQARLVALTSNAERSNAETQRSATVNRAAVIIRHQSALNEILIFYVGGGSLLAIGLILTKLIVSASMPTLLIKIGLSVAVGGGPGIPGAGLIAYKGWRDWRNYRSRRRQQATGNQDEDEDVEAQHRQQQEPGNTWGDLVRRAGMTRVKTKETTSTKSSDEEAAQLTDDEAAEAAEKGETVPLLSGADEVSDDDVEGDDVDSPTVARQG